MFLMHFLHTSPRVAPGLLTLEAWELLRAAPTVIAADLTDPQVRAIVASGIDVSQGSPTTAYEPDDVWVGAAGDVAVHETEVIEGSYDLPGAKVIDLVDVMDRLRLQCPWTKAQSHKSLSHYLLEEAHETLEALDAGNNDDLAEELGDLLMQVVFHARIAVEGAGWSIDDVAAGITDKLIYRNPHVFGDATVDSAEQVDANWQALKAVEKQRSSVLEGIAPTLPALALADKVLGRLGTTSEPPTGADGGDDIGEQLLGIVAAAHRQGIDAEGALRRAVQALVER